MIHIFIGTKAQYVKTAPVLAALDKSGTPYNLIDSGQHGHLAPLFRSYFGIREPDVSLGTSESDITTVPVLVAWMAKMVLTALFRPKWIRQNIFKNQTGVCCIHGDTPTTLISLFLAKRVGISVAHLESGLRSYNVLNPFPEEIIRIIVMRFSDILFAPGPWAVKNLERMHVPGKVVELSGNTNIDAIRIIKARSAAEDIAQLPPQPFALATIHRAETLLHKKRLHFVIKSILNIAENYPVVFCMHPPTKRALISTGLLDAISQHPKITIHNLFPYPQFIEAISNCEFVVTDGGSIQEECYYLNKPCLVMRAATERQEGIGTNALLCRFDALQVDFFLKNIDTFKESGYSSTQSSPSQEIIDTLAQQR